jgi:hypothetical protein
MRNEKLRIRNEKGNANEIQRMEEGVDELTS